jgi:hypothetical protein
VVQSPESENQQEEKNIVDERKNIMDNRNASTEQSIGNNYKEGEMADDEKNTKEKQVSASQAGSKNEGDQQSSPSLSPQSSVSGHSSSSSSFVNVPTSGEGGTDNSNGEHSQTPDSNNDTSSFEKIDEEPSAIIANIESGNGQPANEGRPAVFQFPNDSPPSNGDEYDGLSEVSDVTDEEDIDNYDLSWLFSEEDDNNRQEDPHPTPEPMISLTGKKSEQVNNIIPQDTKSSNLHIIAASILVIAGVVLGVDIAVHLGMPAVGILVGVCCLVAAAVMYHYKWPNSFIEANKVEKVAPNEKKESVATSV